MSVVPDSPIGPGDRFPWVSVFIIAATLVLLLAHLLGWPAADWVWPLAHLLVMALVASATLEYALGVGVYLISLALCALAAGAAMLLSGGPVQGTAWLPLAANAMLGLNVGLLLNERIRPLYFLPGPFSSLVLNWIVLLTIWLLLELVWVLAGTDPPAMLRGLCLGAGALIGMVMAALSLIRPSMVNPGFVEHRLMAGLDQVEQLIDRHKLKQARRLLRRLGGLAPDNPRLKQLRYAAWKFTPDHGEFHLAAGAVLDLPGTDEATNRFVDRMYADYVAVSQGQPRLPLELHLRLATRFASYGNVDEAANIVNVHLQRGATDDAIPPALLAVSEAYLAAGRPNRSAYFSDTLVGLFPKSREAGAGRRILHQIATEGGG